MTGKYKRQVNEVSYIHREATILDSMIGLLEEPNYVQFLGDRSLAEQKIKHHYPRCRKIIKERDFNDDNQIKNTNTNKPYTNKPYTNKLAIIDIDNNYKLGIIDDTEK